MTADRRNADLKTIGADIPNRRARCPRHGGTIVNMSAAAAVVADCIGQSRLEEFVGLAVARRRLASRRSRSDPLHPTQPRSERVHGFQVLGCKVGIVSQNLFGRRAP